MRSTGKVFVLTLAVVVVLLLMGLLPVVSIDGVETRPVRMLSDLFPERQLPDSLDCLEELEVLQGDRSDVMSSTTHAGLSPCDTVPPVTAESTIPAYTPPGVVPVEDFSQGAPGGMAHFYSRLLQAADGGRRVNIAYFGDSFIESDILACDLREMLQDRYGGSGPGWVDCGGGMNTNRPTVTTKHRGLTEHVVVKKPFSYALEAISQRYYYAENGASLKLSGTKFRPHVGSWKETTLYLQTDTLLTVEVSLGGGEPEARTVDSSDQIQTVSSRGTASTVSYLFPAADTRTRFYGVTLDDTRGVALDNFSMRGTSGTLLKRIPLKALREINRQRPYDLIILHFGLNVVNDSSTNAMCQGYTKQMKRVVEQMRQAFPQASIVIFSVPDREQRDADGLHTLRGISRLVGWQRRLAQDCGVGFLNVFQAMGGPGSMSRLVDSNSAAKDYTHLNFKGGRIIADHIFQSLQTGVDNYRRGAASTSTEP